MAPTSFSLVLLGIAGGMPLLLGIVGIYGVLAYAVVQRQREVGVRLALGAQPGNVKGMFVYRGMMLSGIGIAIGVAVAAGITRGCRRCCLASRPSMRPRSQLRRVCWSLPRLPQAMSPPGALRPSILYGR